ncbi:hypothetical protein, partial [Aeromicrobium piscarium]|uniref:hypothetical protein n=1 Tax=Aeromicrobium piscarium TaxID=2590901 RepID=UPI001C8F7B98
SPTSDRDHVIAELLRIGSRHSDILSSDAAHQKSVVTYGCITPLLVIGGAVAEHAGDDERICFAEHLADGSAAVGQVGDVEVAKAQS